MTAEDNAQDSERIWTDLSPNLLLGAARLAREIHAFESSHAGPFMGKGEPFEMRASRVLGGIMTACAATEAFANEIFLHAMDRRDGDRFPFTPETGRAVEICWPELERLQPLEKLQRAMALAHEERFDEGTEPFQSAKLAFQLRNVLVHYKTRPLGNSPAPDVRKLQKRLAGRFEVSTTAAFPYDYLRHSCVEWVIKAQLALLDACDAKLRVGHRMNGFNYETR